MSASEKIGGVELSTYGLRLSDTSNFHILPAYKNILPVNDLDVEMRILQEKEVGIVLIGKYTNFSTLYTNVDNFFTKVKSAVKLEWYFAQHDFQKFCVVKSGIKVNFYRENIAVLKFNLAITTET